MQSDFENQPKGAFTKGPRNLPKPDKRKVRRRLAKAARKRNREAYSGQ